MTKIYEQKILSGKKDDARVLRSKRDLSEALISLLNKKSYHSITVKDICEKAMISKLCFYNNFVNKDDLMIYIFKRETDEKLNEVRQESIDKNQKEVKYEDIINALISMFFSPNKIFRKIISTDKDKALYEIINKYIKDTIPNLLSYCVPEKLNYIPNDFSVTFFSGALTGILYTMCGDTELNKNENSIDYIATLTTSTLLSSK